MNGSEAAFHLSSTTTPRSNDLPDDQTAHPALSGSLEGEQDGPPVGHRMQAVRSVLAIVVDQQCVFAGLQGGDISVWSLESYSLVLSVRAHRESVLGLFLSTGGSLLFSSGGDSVVNVWSTRTFERLYSIHSHHDVGDIFSIVYSSDLKTVYCGAQNTSIQWRDLGEGAHPPPDSTAHPSYKTHKFFDSKGPGAGRIRSTRDPNQETYSGLDHGGELLTFKREQHKLFAHHGYVYCMLLVRGLLESDSGAEVLLTGSGDGSVKMWHIQRGPSEAPSEMVCLSNGSDPVLSIAVDGPFLYCGLSGGAVNIWNLDSRQIIKTITSLAGDVWAIDIVNGTTICGDLSGVVKKFNSRFEEIGSWTAHDGILLSSAVGIFEDRTIYATGGNDSTVAVWDLTGHPSDLHEIPAISNDEMVNTLAKFVGFKTISSRPKFAGECNQGAAFLRRHCTYLGAQTKLLATGPDTNPIVFARFTPVSKRPVDNTILFYGHYDVVGVESIRLKWRTDPFHLTSLNGYLYGRGVTDNKGPLLAALYAAAESTKTKELACNVVFLIEGEEEAGSQGFAQTVQANKDLIGKVDWILLANSYWLDDHIPCLTYGLRGVIHANLVVSSRHPDLHSGIDGSSLLDEPLKDLTMLLGALVGPKGKIRLPGFHDPVLPLSEAEKERYVAIAEALMPHHPEIEDADAFTDSLMHRWREPSLTIHSTEAPGCKSSSTTISRKAKAALSIRLVPNQNVEKVAADLVEFCQSRFADLETQNILAVEITGKADPWLGDPENDLFHTLSRAVTAAWSTDEKSKRYSYPLLELFRRPSHVEMPRTDSSESIASNANRVISSSPVAPDATTVRSTLSGSYVPRPSIIPTSSTLADNTGDRAHTPAESGTQSPVATPAVSSSTAHAMPSSSTATATGTSASTKPKPSAPQTPQALSASHPDPRNPRHHLHSHSHQHQQPQRQQQQQHTPSRTPPPPPPPRVRKPLYIREGGSIPTIRFLEKAFDAPAAHLPCGQASDNAHLDNERLRVENLYKSREIFGAVFGELGRMEGRGDVSDGEGEGGIGGGSGDGSEGESGSESDDEEDDDDDSDDDDEDDEE